MTLEVQTNCKPCMQGNHKECLKENCLCKNDNHGVKIPTLKEGVKVNDSKPIDENFYDDVKEVNNEIRKEPKAYRNDNWDLVASEIQSENYFLTLRENKNIWYFDRKEGIYKPFGHTIIEESCQRMIERCQNKTVKEIVETIRRNKTMIDMKELFDSKHINTQNGILDPILN